MSEATRDRRDYTIDEYFALEERTGEKHLYLDGIIIAMAGGTYMHSKVITNALLALGTALRGKRCSPIEGGMRVQFGRRGRYGYGDVVVHCGPPIFDDADPKHLVLTNLTLVVEVLSASTERYDRSKKFSLYCENPHFREYVLISQEWMRVETFLKQADETWRFSYFEGPDARVPLGSIDAELTVGDLYAGLDVPASPPDDAHFIGM